MSHPATPGITPIGFVIGTQADAAALRIQSRLDPVRFPDAGPRERAAAPWACPKCRRTYPQAAAPSTYTCFCGKQVDPVFDPWLAPHTCGELCGMQSTHMACVLFIPQVEETARRQCCGCYFTEL